MVKGVLLNVLDLTDRDVQARLGTSLQELTGAWRPMQTRGELAPTQMLGQLAYESNRFMGLRSSSAANTDHGHILVVFTGRLRSPSGIEVYDPTGRLTQRLP